MVLVRNEDLHINRAITNILGFCDEILVADHGSTDETPAILENLSAAHPEKLRVFRIRHPRESHHLLHPYAGKNVWVFGVDGDEIYDPAGLEVLRGRLLGGEFSKFWMILGNVLNCVSLDPVRGVATGHLAPPCRSITKLYNFAAITSWKGPDIRERLHGGQIRFKQGWDSSLRYNLHEELPWENSPLRCLHLCFLPRSSSDGREDPPRRNIMELYQYGVRGFLQRALAFLPGHQTGSSWKRSRYMRGSVHKIDARPFYPLNPS